MAEETKNTATTNNASENQQTENKAQAEQNANETTTDSTPSVESLMAEIAKMKAEVEKSNLARDKAMKERGDAVKALREKQSAEEIADEAKREQEEAHNAYVKDLEQFKTRTLAKDRYLMQGMTVEMADKAAQAEVDGDMDTLATIQKQHTDAALKAAKAEWQKTQPEANRGNGNAPTMTKEEIFAIKDPAERRKAIAANMALFN